MRWWGWAIVGFIGTTVPLSMYKRYLGRYILLDGWVSKMDRPWLKKNLDELRDLGHADLLPILAVRTWGCPK